MIKELLELREDLLKLMSEDRLSFKSIKKNTGVTFPTVIKLFDYLDEGKEISQRSRESLRVYCDELLND